MTERIKHETYCIFCGANLDFEEVIDDNIGTVTRQFIIECESCGYVEKHVIEITPPPETSH